MWRTVAVGGAGRRIRRGVPVADGRSWGGFGWAKLTLIVLPLSVGQEVGYQIPDLSATLRRRRLARRLEPPQGLDL
jgi:hypothetical protein